TIAHIGCSPEQASTIYTGEGTALWAVMMGGKRTQASQERGFPDHVGQAAWPLGGNSNAQTGARKGHRFDPWVRDRARTRLVRVFHVHKTATQPCDGEGGTVVAVSVVSTHVTSQPPPTRRPPPGRGRSGTRAGP